MNSASTQPMSNSRGALWAGRVMSGIAIAFLAADSVGKLLQAQPVLDATKQLGYPVGVAFGLGVVLLGCVAVYAFPRTSTFGAVLLTGYLGGAIATHVRVSDPLFTHTLFPVYMACLIWGGVFLRDARVRAALSPRSRA